MALLDVGSMNNTETRAPDEDGFNGQTSFACHKVLTYILYQISQRIESGPYTAGTCCYCSMVLLPEFPRNPEGFQVPFSHILTISSVGLINHMLRRSNKL